MTLLLSAKLYLINFYFINEWLVSFKSRFPWIPLLTPILTQKCKIINFSFFFLFFKVLKELCSVLESCGTDTRCKCLLLTSSGSLFSSGVDLPCLLSEVPQVRSNAAKAMALAVKEFAHKLGMFSKVLYQMSNCRP